MIFHEITLIAVSFYGKRTHNMISRSPFLLVRMEIYGPWPNLWWKCVEYFTMIVAIFPHRFSWLFCPRLERITHLTRPFFSFALSLSLLFRSHKWLRYILKTVFRIIFDAFDISLSVNWSSKAKTLKSNNFGAHFYFSSLLLLLCVYFSFFYPVKSSFDTVKEKVVHVQ